MSRLVVVALALASGACGPGEEDPPLECIDPATPALDTSCMPLYPPTFDNIYNMTLRPKCVGSGCHGGGGQGGLGMSTIDGAYAELLEAEQLRVVPGDPACSEMIIRTTASEQAIKMPPGVSLLAAEKCALVQWVANGALR
jgi:hypothetical protein